ncbi:MAG: hypothetical protein QW334_03265 [Thermofilum sp.]
MMREEVERRRRAVEEVLRRYVDRFRRLEVEGVAEPDGELARELRRVLDEVAWKREGCLYTGMAVADRLVVEKRIRFTALRCCYRVGSFRLPQKVYDVYAAVDYVLVEGRPFVYLSAVDVFERGERNVVQKMLFRIR